MLEPNSVIDREVPGNLPAILRVAFVKSREDAVHVVEVLLHEGENAAEQHVSVRIPRAARIGCVEGDRTLDRGARRLQVGYVLRIEADLDSMRSPDFGKIV